MDVIFDLATSDDDAALRRMLARNPVPGSVSVAYEREPSYFAGCATSGSFYQVPVARVGADGALAGFALRAVRERFVNGVPTPVGYLSHLRVDGRYRGNGLTGRGFPFLRQLHGDGRTPAYLATVIEGNGAAQRLLLDHPPPDAPRFRPLDRILTLALVARPRKPLVGNCAIVRGDQVPLAMIVKALHEYGAQRQFFPCYREEDLSHSPVTQGFCINDFLLATRGGRVIGTVGLWDQGAYKQAIVRGYSGPVRLLRPALNLAARVWGAQPLPAVGAPIRSIYASFVCVAPGAEDAFAPLLRAAANEAARRGYAFLIIGLAERDPLLPLARRYAHITYASRLYLAHWEDGEGLYAGLDGRIPNPEIATL